MRGRDGALTLRVMMEMVTLIHVHMMVGKIRSGMYSFWMVIIFPLKAKSRTGVWMCTKTQVKEIMRFPDAMVIINRGGGGFHQSGLRQLLNGYRKVVTMLGILLEP